jgi:hypothetical protein
MNVELSIKPFREPEKAPEQSQRALSKSCGVSLGVDPLLPECADRKGLCEGAEFQEFKKQACLFLYFDTLWDSYQKETYLVVFKA